MGHLLRESEKLIPCRAAIFRLGPQLCLHRDGNFNELAFAHTQLPMQMRRESRRNILTRGSALVGFAEEEPLTLRRLRCHHCNKQKKKSASGDNFGVSVSRSHGRQKLFFPGYVYWMMVECIEAKNIRSSSAFEEDALRRFRTFCFWMGTRGRSNRLKRN